MSSAIDEIVARAAAIRVADRYSTAAEMLEAIENVAVKEQRHPSATAVGGFLCELFGDEVRDPT